MLLGKSTAMTKRLAWFGLQVCYFGLQYYNYSISFLPQLLKIVHSL